MRTALRVNAIFLLLPGRGIASSSPMANVHQPSIRARTAAHDISIRSSTIAGSARRGWASHSVSRSWQTIDDPENARTGPSAWGDRSAIARALFDGEGRVPGRSRAPASAKLLVVDLVAEHDIETHEELTSKGDFRLGPAATLPNGEVATPKIVVRPRPPGPGPSGGAHSLAW